MTFDPTIGLGSLITLVVAVVGGIGAWFTLKSRLDELWSRFTASTTQTAAHHDQNQTRMREIELQIERECVKKDDFTRFEDRVNTKFEKIEHAVNNGALKTAQIVKDAIRDMLPRGRE